MTWKPVKDKTIEQYNVEANEEGFVRYTTEKGYMVETSGEVRSAGYATVRIGEKYYAMGRLIANAFYDNTLPVRKTDNREVDHSAGRANNRLENIRIVENHRTNCRLPWSKKNYSKANSDWHKFGTAFLYAYKEDGEHLVFADGWQGVKDFFNEHSPNSVRQNVEQAVLGRSHTAYGYHWIRFQDPNFSPHRHKSYQREYHRAWRERQQHRDIPADQLEAMTPADILDYYGK